MPNPHSPRELTSQQLQRLRAYIYVDPPLDHYQFLSKWDISRELTAQICRCDLRTINAWFAHGRIHRSPQEYYLWHLSFADIILERFDELPDFLQLLLSPVDDF
ncbi:helix-turn-helix domain-containing protein [Nostoc sp. CHAB 5834]|nr:helix-turn-helix domain-containing protein [Nostoc sp. CHAB 5834]